MAAVLQPTGFSRMIAFRPKAIALLVVVLLLVSLLFPIRTGDRIPPRFGDWRPEYHERHSLLVVGDSLSIALGEQLERHFARYSNCVTFERLGKVSSGLARPEFFNWERNLDELVSRLKPGIVVIMIGANDNKPLKRENATIAFGTTEWAGEYTARLDHMQEICRRGGPNVRVFWIGVPIMGDSALTRDVKIINKVIESWCRDKPTCEFVDTWSALADKDGKYTQFLPDGQTGGTITIRAKDGVHLSPYGAYLLAGLTIDSICRYFTFE
jgi:hypothetical protein